MVLSPGVKRFMAPLLIGLAALTGCGPVTASRTIAEATVALEAARGAHAERLAIYEFTGAVTFLAKAREEEGFSDFDAASRLALRAKALADAATRRAQTAARGGALHKPGGTP